MSNKRLALALLASTALVAAIACGTDDDGGASPATPSTPLASSSAGAGRTATSAPQGTATPGDGSSGIPAVDAAVAAMQSGDYAGVEEMFAFHFVACAVDVMGIGGPPECEAAPRGNTPQCSPRNAKAVSRARWSSSSPIRA
jgi:hypothetical protein